MKTLVLTRLSTIKARTFELNDLIRLAQTGLVKYESMLDRLLEKSVPIHGRPYRPSGLERQVIDELERAEGWLAREPSLH